VRRVAARLCRYWAREDGGESDLIDAPSRFIETLESVTSVAVGGKFGDSFARVSQGSQQRCSPHSPISASLMVVMLERALSRESLSEDV
jgi:hypothetical protein